MDRQELIEARAKYLFHKEYGRDLVYENGTARCKVLEDYLVPAKVDVGWFLSMQASQSEAIENLKNENRILTNQVKALSEMVKQIPVNSKAEIEKAKTNRPKIVCLCGSTRFKDAFMNEYARLSDAGNIVLTVSRLIPTHRNDIKEWDFPEQESVWHELHFRKIDLADEILVLNVGGYIGQSLKAEIKYAITHGKPVKYLKEPEKQEEKG